MILDLIDDIKVWQEQGDQIMLLTDANEHVGNEEFISAFREIGLTEAILDKHRDTNGVQLTHQRGKDPIDGIFLSANIEVQAAGYLSFGEAPSDHRGLWVQLK